MLGMYILLLNVPIQIFIVNYTYNKYQWTITSISISLYN